MLWELFFMLVVLKIPVVYLCAIVWWAIRAEPYPLEGAVVGAGVPGDPSPACDWRGRMRRRTPRPRTHGGGGRGRYVPARRLAAATAHARRVAA